jgi:flagella basal body P-ring formation protein FlgA
MSASSSLSSTPRRALPRRVSRFAHAIVVGCLLAASAAPSRGESPYAQSVRGFLDTRASFPGGEIEISVGEPDPRLLLAPCARYEPFLPAGARLIGRTSIGVRCLEGAQWSIYLPVQIGIFVPALVAARPLARGQALTPDDVRAERIDVAPLHGNFLLSDGLPVGYTAARAFAAGEPLRRDALRAPPIVQPGDAVQVVAVGTGFAAQTSGRALALATEGQSVQVALGNGRIVRGIAKANGVVEVR